MKLVGKKHLTTKVTLMKQFGARIKKLRNERGFTQEDLAEVMNSHASYIGAIEVGKKFPRVETLAKIAESLDVPIYQLFVFESSILKKQQSIQELVDYLKKRPENDAKFLLSVCREHAKQYYVGEKKLCTNRKQKI